jgi:hypothetical protein
LLCKPFLNVAALHAKTHTQPRHGRITARVGEGELQTNILDAEAV